MEFFNTGKDAEKSDSFTSLNYSPQFTESIVNSLNKCSEKQIQLIVNLIDSFNE